MTIPPPIPPVPDDDPYPRWTCRACGYGVKDKPATCPKCGAGHFEKAQQRPKEAR